MTASQPAKTQTNCVLIVEDNDLNMKLFVDLLRSQGYQTVMTRDGLDTLELAREHSPFAIIMDIQLPEISGLEITRRLKLDPQLQTIPVIAVTAFAMQGDEEKIRAAGCDDYLAKPISVNKFVQTVQKYKL